MCKCTIIKLCGRKKRKKKSDQDKSDSVHSLNYEDGGRKEKKISQPGTKINVHSHTMGAKKK